MTCDIVDMAERQCMRSFWMLGIDTNTHLHPQHLLVCHKHFSDAYACA